MQSYSELTSYRISSAKRNNKRSMTVRTSYLSTVSVTIAFAYMGTATGIWARIWDHECFTHLRPACGFCR